MPLEGRVNPVKRAHLGLIVARFEGYRIRGMRAGRSGNRLWKVLQPKGFLVIHGRFLLSKGVQGIHAA